MSDTVSKTLEKLLEDDRNFDTRAGLRLYAELVRDAFRYIEDQKKREGEKSQVQNSILTRIGVVETGLREFMELRKKEQERAETDREKWRWAIIGPMAFLMLNQIFEWVKAFAEWAR
jgi:hypothetical protein